MNKRVLIFGGSSFIALNLIEKFLMESYDVVVYGRTKPHLESPKLTFIQGELSNLEDKIDILKTYNIQSAIYLINNIPVNTPTENYDLLIEENKSALKLIFSAVERVIYFSSGGRVYENSDLPHKESDRLSPVCSYGKSKVELERFISQYGKSINKEHLIIRPSNPFGKYQKIHSNQGLIAVLIGKIRENKKVQVWGTGKEIRDYIYIDDFVNLFFRLFQFRDVNYTVFNIGSGSGVATIDVINAVFKEMKTDMCLEYLNVQREIILTNILDNSRLFSVIGGYEITSLEDGLRIFISQVKNAKHID